MKQLEIWWAQLPAPAGPRPVLLLTRDPACQYLNKFIVAEITTTVRRIPLAKRLGRLTEGRRVEVKRALGAALGWEELALAEN